MNLEQLISQEPFNKWIGKFLRDYTKGNSNIMIQPVGTQGSMGDTGLLKMFMGIMLRERPEGTLRLRDLLDIFYVWYGENSKYHTGYAPPRAVLVAQMEEKYETRRIKGEWVLVGVEAVVSTLEEARSLIDENRDLLQYQLPDPDPDYEQISQNQKLIRRVEEEKLRELGYERGE